MAFRYPRPHAEVWVPDGESLDAALARTTDLGIVAHQDDLEFAALAPIAACRDDPDRWFTGVTCTDGAGSARAGAFAACTDEEMRVLRRQEQRAAAEIGRYGAIFQLGHPSAAARGDGHGVLVAELVEILEATRPVNVYTHNLADKHSTHLAAVAATIEAQGLTGLVSARLPLDLTPMADEAAYLASAKVAVLNTSSIEEVVAACQLTNDVNGDSDESGVSLPKNGVELNSSATVSLEAASTMSTAGHWVVSCIPFGGPKISAGDLKIQAVRVGSLSNSKA